MPRRPKTTDKQFEELPLHQTPKGVQLFCSLCGEIQRKSDGGETCPNGHGGADSVLEAEASAIRATAAKLPAEESKLKELSKELKAELAASEQDPTDWHGQRQKMRQVDYADGYRRIIETMVVDDPEETYKKLHKALTIGADRTEYGMVLKHLDEAEGHYREAFSLSVTADLAYREWELDNEVVFSAAVKAATEQLQHEKERGQRNKQITDADVQARIAVMYPDEWREVEKKRARMKGMRDSIRNLVEVWASRCRSLQTMASKLR
jgi:hypothetical protein